MQIYSFSKCAPLDIGPRMIYRWIGLVVIATSNTLDLLFCWFLGGGVKSISIKINEGKAIHTGMALLCHAGEQLLCSNRPLAGWKACAGGVLGCNWIKSDADGCSQDEWWSKWWCWRFHSASVLCRCQSPRFTPARGKICGSLELILNVSPAHWGFMQTPLLRRWEKNTVSNAYNASWCTASTLIISILGMFFFLMSLLSSLFLFPPYVFS